jgi:TadE-like protein
MRSSTDRTPTTERGATLVEFAVLAPLLILLLFGIVEMGLALRDQLTVANSVSGAARIGSVVGNQPEADIAVLDAVEAGLVGGLDADVITKVIIYKANLDGSSSGLEDHYTYDPSDPTCPWSPCPDPVHPSFGGYGSPSSYPPSGRIDTLPDPDIIGVRVEYQHNWATTVLPFMQTPAAWDADARMRLEPDVSGT